MAIFNSGTKTIFHQTAAPTGWVKETTNYNDHALRVVSGTTLTSGGSVDFTTVFPTVASTFTNPSVAYVSGDTTLTVAMMATHSHTVSPTARFYVGTPRAGSTTVPPAVVAGNFPFTGPGASPPSNSGGAAHNHPITVSVSGNFFSNSPNSNIGVNYIDVIIATLT